MTVFVNCGVKHKGDRVLTKKALKQLVEIDRHDGDLLFDVTSSFAGYSYVSLSQLSPDITLEVTGPDPYHDRKWHAMITVTDEGKVTVK